MRAKLELVEEMFIENRYSNVFAYNDEYYAYWIEGHIYVFRRMEKTLKMCRFDDVTKLAIKDDRLFVCTQDVHIMDIKSLALIGTIRTTKSNVADISVADELMAISKIDGVIYLYNFLTSLRLAKIICTFIPKMVLLSQSHIGAYDDENIVVYTYDGKIVYSVTCDNVIRLLFWNDSIWVITSSTIWNLVTNKKTSLDEEVIGAAVFSNHLFVATSVCLIDFLAKTKILLRDILVSHFYKKTVHGILNVEAGVEIRDVQDGIVVTDDNDIIFWDGNTINEIFCFNENATGCFFDETYLYVSTSKGSFKKALPHSRIFSGAVLPVSKHSLSNIVGGETSIKFCSMTIPPTLYSFDLITMAISKLSIPFPDAIDKNTTITAFDSDGTISVFGTAAGDCIINSDVPVSFNISNKYISGMKILQTYIAVLSYDSNTYFYTKNAKVCKKVIPIHKPLCMATDGKYILICGHKQIKILNAETLEEVKTYSVKRPVFNCMVWSNLEKPYFIAITDGIKVYVKESPILWVDMGFKCPWSASGPFLCAENKISRINYQIKEIMSKKEIALKKDMLLLRNNYVEAINLEIDEKKKFKLLSDYFSEELLVSIKNIGDVLVKNGQIRDAYLFNQILRKSPKLKQTQLRQIATIVEKHKKTVSEMYIFLKRIDDELG